MNDSTKWFRLEPVDAWFFRGGHPFNAGEDQGATESIFPPHPPTVVGALRASLARAQGWNGRDSWPPELTEVLGDGWEDLGQLSFQGPFLWREKELLFPMPLHVAGHIDEASGKRRFEPEALLRPSHEFVLCDAGETRLPMPPPTARKKSDKPPKPPEGFYVTAAGMARILDGRLPEQDACVPAEALYVIETRIGIQRDAEKRTTGENAMYAPRYVRLQQGVSLAVGIAGLPEGWALPELMPLGGESRLAACTRANAPDFPAAPSLGGQQTLLLLTPARFESDQWWGAGPGDSAGQLDSGASGTVVCAAIDRPLGIGGWDSLKRKPLPMLPHVAPGAVWWLEDAQEEAGALSIGGRQAYGFGMTLRGAWPRNESNNEEERS